MLFTTGKLPRKNTETNKKVFALQPFQEVGTNVKNIKCKYIFLDPS